MNIIILFTLLVAFHVTNLIAEDVSEKTMDVTFFIEEAPSFMANEKLEMVWCSPLKYRRDHYVFYYTNLSMLEDKIDLTDFVSNSLLQIGYEPTSWFPLEECKPWNCKSFLDYKLSPISIDKFGNVLILFSYKQTVFQNKEIRKLCVWNKDYGLKVLIVPGVDSVSYESCVKENYLIVRGFDLKLNKANVVITSVSEGYWDERKQCITEPEPIISDLTVKNEASESVVSEEPLLESHESIESIEKTSHSWWEINKPTWWP